MFHKTRKRSSQIGAGCSVAMPAVPGGTRIPRAARAPAVIAALTVVCLVLASSGILWAQASGADSSAEDVSSSPLPLPESQIPSTMQPDLVPPAVPDNYQIGHDDLLSIFVYQMPEMTRQVRVDQSGMIRLPFTRVQIKAAGHTATQLAANIGAELVKEGLAAAPQVQVVVRQVMSRPIVVAGAVKHPGVIQASRPMYLLEVLARAGGLDSTSGTRVLLSQSTPVGTVTKTIDLYSVLNTEDPRSNPLLTGGEVVRVLPAQMVYTVGALSKPSAFPIETGRPITVLNALSLSQGFNPATPADKSHAEIIRTLPDGSRQEVPINLEAILQHHAPDPDLTAGDILYVPESSRRKLLNAVLGDAGQAAIIGIGYGTTRVF